MRRVKRALVAAAVMTAVGCGGELLDGELYQDVDEQAESEGLGAMEHAIAVNPPPPPLPPPEDMPVCGDGVVEGWEKCDGYNLDGKTCGSLGTTGGTLRCALNCLFDTTTCGPCKDGRANCDGKSYNGCEINLTKAPSTGSSTSPDYLGVVNGNTTVSLLTWLTGCTLKESWDCKASNKDSGPTRQARGTRFMTLKVRDVNPGLECPGCLDQIKVKVKLSFPCDMDYQLYVDGKASTAAASCVTNPITGSKTKTRTITRSWTDRGSINDTRKLPIEVRHAAGTSCDSWTLRTYGGAY